jgi:hypothetical protein
MARTRSVDFLPEIFQTSTNRQVLAATLDQLIQEPQLKQIQGFVGRRVGPGVVPGDYYVTEPTATRTNYQLEPGVVQIDPINSKKVVDAITYPGITDALNLQGAVTQNADQLYTSEYYSWDPFVDFDKYINYAQYYWLPGGPNAVDVFTGAVPTTDNFVVTRANGAYTFSGATGENPTLTLVRGGSYTFQVAQNQTTSVDFRVSNKGTSAWVIDYETNPTLTLVRGNTYTFTLVSTPALPFYIKTQQTLGINNLFTDGVTNNGAATGTITFTVPQSAPNTLYYNNSMQMNMQGVFTIVDSEPGTGPDFWIQTDPGVNGRIPSTPNISSRLGPVNGVTNNGIDLGTVTFAVPLSDAQDFYYDLPYIDTNNGQVGLITGLQFDQLNNVFVEQFLAQYPDGIDGITNLDGRTIVFTEPDADPDSGGWLVRSQFDPLVRTAPPTDPVIAGPGSFDSLYFDQTTPIADVAIQRSVWQIQYITAEGGGQYMRLVSVYNIPDLYKFNIQFGTVYSNTSWYKDETGAIQQIPLLAATRNRLYYQDGVDPGIFGEINLINQSAADSLMISDIIGKKNYTSPNGVVFTNGLKVQFIGSVVPATYQGNSYYVEGVGTAIQLLPVTDFVTPETYTQSSSVPYDSTLYDFGNYDASLNQPAVPDYLTINRASPDLNPWSRSNRWFHISVIEQTATYNNSPLIVNNARRARRPILEFRGGTRLFDFGTKGKQPVDIIDFSNTDAFSTVNGSTGYGVDGYNLINGSRIIFAADLDPDVRDKIYVVEFITPDTVPPLLAEPVINLTPAANGDILVDNSVVCLSGNTLQGISFWFDGVNWIRSQQKTATNQAPFFDVYDANGVSFSDPIVYPSSDFKGSKLFSYAPSDNGKDPVLGFAIKYLSLSNIGDIVFDNNLYTDTFNYTVDSVGYTNNISLGFVRQYQDRLVYQRKLGWQTAAIPSRARQQFQFSYNGQPLQLDVAALPNSVVPSVQLYVSSEFQESYKYSVATTANSTTITWTDAAYNNGTAFATGDIVEVLVLSDQASKVAFYQVPINLENNPLNVNSPYFTVGTARTHYESICENLLGLVGPINGNNNTRDLGNIVPYGTNILQNSAPMTLAGYFMRSKQYNIFDSLAYSSREYEQYKAQLLNAAVTTDYTNYTVPAMLTAIVTQLIAGRTENNPFYWTDMLPANPVYTTSTTTYSQISTPVFNLNTTYNFASSNYQSVLVYVNDVILQSGYDYVVSTDTPTLTITVPLAVGDVIVIQEYATTYGTFVPNTPTKLGLYPAFQPKIYYDTTYVNPAYVIQGHDGSLTLAFGDFRDQLLLEFETRIFNNLKIKSEIPLTITDVTPGQFRSTGYSLSEINEILAPSFLSWLGWNKLTYTEQNYIANNQFTWNYSAAGNRLTGSTTSNESPLPVGAWRGIYQYFYDTPTPQSTPWEMLGFSQEPTWWTQVYGPAPYTSGNLVLWDDLSLGRVADPAGTYYLPKYARPGLTQVLPVDSEGTLLSPFFSVTGLYDSSQWQKSWVFGDEGPVEYSWRTSSAFPFAVMRLLALTRPAEFFSVFADRDLYKYDADLEQFLYNGRYRLDANGVQVYGNGISKASYIDWIVDYNRQLGINSTDKLTKDLTLLDVRLCYRMGTFTDKQYLEIVAETASPNSTNSSLMIPDNSYNLLVYKNQPFDQILYSAVIVQVVDGGWSVTGYSLTNPYFEILASRTGGPTRVISAGGTRVTVPTTYTQNIVQVPYGYVFTNQTVVADFLLSYGALLESQGLVFDARENGKTLNWDQMVQEYLYWANQGWMAGSVISLNPTAQQLTLVTPEAVVDSIVTQTPENLILDQNRTTIPTAQLVIDRYENTFKVNSLNEQTISYIALRRTSYESLVILDNVSVFGDLLYDPATGARQSRVTVIATVAADWNGQLDAQGFINNNTQTVREWQPLQKYTKGEIVIYKNNYWQALDIVQPSTQWNQSLWSQSNYTRIQGGLLQNIPLLANQLANSYDVNQANLQLEQDLFAFGLIGFRPRQYMVDLNLSDISQVNLYQQLIKDKGTLNSVRLLTNANLNKETAQYQIYENWGIQRGIYGANANRQFVEMRLNEALLTANPATVQITAPQEYSVADQTILYSDLWRQSYNVTSPDIFPTAFMPVADSALPSAGYVNLNDVDITVFDLEGQLGLANGVLNTIGIGTTVWAAKSNAYDWNVYRCTEVPGYVSSAVPNLNGTTIVTFTQPPGLAVGNIVIIRFLNTAVDGVYRVLARPGLTSIAIALTITNPVTGSGLAFSLQTMRVSQASDVLNLPYTAALSPGAKVWVDDNGSGQWEVLQKTDPFTDAGAITPTVPVANSGYGAAVAQGYQNIIAMIGAPTGGDAGTGAIYTYVKDVNDNYSENSTLILNASGTQGFGTAIQIGYQNWAIAGAGASNGNQGYAVAIYRATGSTAFEQRQLLTSPDGDVSRAEFGYSVTISQDEQWMYVSAPGQNKVYPYGRVTIPAQSVQFVTTGVYQVYNVGGTIEFDNELQLAVVLNNNLLTIGVDYTVAGTVINLSTVPLPGEKLIVTRKVEQDYVGDGAETIFDLGPYLYTADNIESFSVYVDDVIQVPDVDYTFSTSGDYPIEFATAPAADSVIKVFTGTYWLSMNPIEGPASSRFGSSIHTTTDGRQIVIGASNDSSGSIAHSGATYVFDRSVIRYIISDTTQLTYALPGGYQNPVAVVLNNTYLTNTAQYLNGQFTVDGGNVVLNVVLNVGDVLEIESNIFKQVQKIVPDTPYDESAFGAAVDICPNNCSIYSGAPVDGTELLAAGSVQRNVNQARVYGTITSINANPTLTAGNTIRINNTPVAVPAGPNNTVAGLAQAIVAAEIPNITASAANGRLTINIVNVAAADAYNRLTVWPGTSGTAFADLGFNTYAYTQTIVSPNPSAGANFGTAVNIDTAALTLVVGAPRGNLYEAVIFDNGTTYFDDRSTTFFNAVLESGVVYTFDYLPSATDSVTNPGNFVFGQQIYDNLTDPLDQWGAAVNYTTGKLLIGSPTGADNYGRVGQLVNLNRLPAWKVLHKQQPVVDVALLNSVYMYNKLQSQETYFFDFIDPLQGKILGAARQNIDFISQVNPAQYNFGPINNIGNFWGSERVGTIWWNTTNARFIDPNQDDIVYASRRWGQLFPSSTVDVYQWVASPTPPVSYTGEGTPLNTTSYSVRAHLTATGIFETVYYFWVSGITTIAVNERKTLSTTGIARYIQEPRSSGIPYIAALDASTVAIYNGSQYLSASDTILHVEFSKQLSESNIHTEFQLIADGNPTSFLADNLYQKLQDSFCGYNQNGAQVPDPFLSPPEQYGVAFSPRQSMFVDRLMALENYLTRANEILKYLPIVEQRRFILLNSSEPVPSQGSDQYNRVLDNIDQLSYQNLYQVPLGYQYLILSDSTYNGAWTIYEVVLASNAPTAPRVPQLVRIQNFNTKNYWHYVDWYQLGYNSSITPVAQVSNYASLVTLTVSVGASVKVTANAQNKWEIYIKTTTGWDRVGLQDGTIAFDNTLWDYAAGRYGFDAEVYDAQFYDQEPVIETRNIIQAINDELFTNDLAIFKNQLLILMFKFILTEEQAPDWLMKTSLINVRHDIRSLLPFPTYRRDNQNFVSDYLQEVKPYHVQVKQFNLVYKGQDDYPGFATDFDNPAYYNTTLEIPQFVSPILLPYTKSTAIGTGQASTIADTPADAEIWATTPWQEWYNNYLLSLLSVSVTATGSGYAAEPTVIIGTEWTADTVYTVGQQVFYGNNLYSVTKAGTSADVPPAFTSGSQLVGTATLTRVGTPATAVAVINSLLQVIAVNVVDPGSGYTTNPIIIFVSDTGSGAQARANMNNPLVREFNMTIKYDRYEYLSTITDWNYLVAMYPADTQVRFADTVWQAIDTVVNTPIVLDTTGTAGAYTLTVSSTTGLTTGMIVTGLGIPADTTVTLINTVDNVVTTSRAVLQSITLSPINFYNPFVIEQWNRVPASTLSGVNRTQGFYLPTVDQPGRSLPLLIDGLTYPGVQVHALDFSYNTGYDVGNYDINPFDNISISPEGFSTYDPALLDANYSSSFDDVFLGIRPTDINVDGGGYIDVFSSYAPEELVPGSEFDTLDFRVYTAPGFDNTGLGHGFPAASIRYVYDPENPVLSFAGALEYPFVVVVFNTTLGLAVQAAEYNWPNYTVTVGLTETAGDIIDLYVTGVGGGNQLYLNTYNQNSLDQVTVPFAVASPWDIATTYVQGDVVSYSGEFYQATAVTTGNLPPNLVGWTLTSQGAVIYSTTVDDVVTYPGILIYNGENQLLEGTDYTVVSSGGSTTVTFATTYDATARINLAVLGFAVDGPTHSWSLPVAQSFVSTGTTTTIDLVNSMQGTNQVNLVVSFNGNRMNPYQGREYIGNGATLTYQLPNSYGYNPALVSNNDVLVFVDNVKFIQGTDYVVNAYDGISTYRTITFVTALVTGSKILLSVATNCGYRVYNDSLTFLPGSQPGPGDSIDIITWNDTAEQGLLTEVLVGPGTIDNNTFELGREIANPERLLVTFNGYYLFNGLGYVLNGTTITVSGQTITSTDVLAITFFTNRVVPNPTAFRIFQDMRQVQATYRITPATATALVQPVGILDDTIYVEDAAALGDPNLASSYNNNISYAVGAVVMYGNGFYQAIEPTVGHVPTDTDYWTVTEGAANIWGILTIDGERIMYRYRDIEANTVSGLLRGTAGTAITTHATGTAVYNMGRENLMPETCQNYIVSNITNPLESGVNLGDGTTVEFVAEIDISQEPSATRDRSVEVYIGGARIPASDYTITNDNPVTVLFTTAPPAGAEVAILVKRAHTWYNLATPLLPLNETNTICARFLQGR